MLERISNHFRMGSWYVYALLCLALIALISPLQLPVVLYKLSLISVAVLAAYLLDRSLFPYARPDGYLKTDWEDGQAKSTEEPADYPVAAGYELVFAAAMLRRAIIVAAVVLGVAMGL
ncbi:hypothetical protein QF000_000520 [Paraburkholderia atlantica]|uniref:putative holin n=1 Tax=Paraburkholderia atlantica TaxID=2654982 RepID=UPI003D22C746